MIDTAVNKKTPEAIAVIIKKLASYLGFAAAGIIKAQPMAGYEKFRSHYLEKNYNADMAFLGKDVAKRFNPGELMPEAKSIVSLALSYAPTNISSKPQPISYYAQGRDYHKVLKKRAKRLVSLLEEEVGEFESRIFVDTAPVEERQIAVMAGLGWQGKNGMLIIPGIGSMTCLCEIFLSVEALSDLPMVAGCHLCEKCIKACPTKALLGGGLVDAGKCICYHTIENRSEEIPRKVARKIPPRLFGCDTCAAVCPHNQNIPAGDSELINDNFKHPEPEKILEWTWDDWDDFTQGSARRRATLEMYQRNAKITLKQ